MREGVVARGVCMATLGQGEDAGDCFRNSEQFCHAAWSRQVGSEGVQTMPMLSCKLEVAKMCVSPRRERSLDAEQRRHVELPPRFASVQRLRDSGELSGPKSSRVRKLCICA